ncbi:hypothetical protein D9M71_631070 [compost metagenome]
MGGPRLLDGIPWEGVAAERGTGRHLLHQLPHQGTDLGLRHQSPSAAIEQQGQAAERNVHQHLLPTAACQVVRRLHLQPCGAKQRRGLIDDLPRAGRLLRGARVVTEDHPPQPMMVDHPTPLPVGGDQANPTEQVQAVR